MARIHKRRLPSGETVWLLTHGTEPNRTRFVAGRSHQEASETLKQFHQQLALHGQAVLRDSIDATLGRYLAHLRGNRRPATVRRYGRVLRTFRSCFLEPFHPHIEQLRQVRPQHVEEYKQRRLAGTIADESPDTADSDREAQLRREISEGATAPTPRDNARFGWLGRKRLRRSVTPKTVNYELRVIQTFCLWAVRHNELLVSPASVVERIRIPKRALPKFIPADDLRRLLAVCNDDRRLFGTLLLAGMRKGEVEHLTWPDISFELGVIVIQAKPDLNWEPKTDERLIPMSPALRQILLKQREQRGKDRFVFANPSGNRDTHILHRLKSYCRKAGIKSYSVHALRHSFGTHLRMAGVSEADIADLLGHRDLSTTRIYSMVHQEYLREQIGKLTKVLDPAPDQPSDTASAFTSILKTLTE